MSTVSATRPTRKPRPKPERRLRILEQPTADTDGWAALSITVGKQTDSYLVRTIPTDFAGTLAFEVEKLAPDLESMADRYHVLLARTPEEHDDCSCPGYQRWGHCKHHAALDTLQRQRPGLFTGQPDPAA